MQLGSGSKAALFVFVLAVLAPSSLGQFTGGSEKRGAGDGREKAILDGLRWLVRHQNPDGSWSPSTLNERCECDAPAYHPKTAYSKNYDEGLTGLALLCFVDAGFTPESKNDIVDTSMAKRHKVGEVVKHGLDWLVKKQNADGSFSTGSAFMYNEAIASLAVTGVYALTKDDAWKDPAQKSIDFIQGAQRPNRSGKGLWGWRYASRQELERVARGGDIGSELYEADSSVTGWCALALGTASRAGLTVGTENIDGALAFTRWVTAGDGLVGYIDPKGAGATVTGPNDHYVYHLAVMSALGVCTRLECKQPRDDAFFDVAAKRIAKDPPTISEDKLSIDYYYWFWATRALYDLDGPNVPGLKSNERWRQWNAAVLDALLALQDRGERACTNGGWMRGDRWSYDGGPLYATAINLLTLETYYRTR